MSVQVARHDGVATLTVGAHAGAGALSRVCDIVRQLGSDTDGFVIDLSGCQALAPDELRAFMVELRALDPDPARFTVIPAHSRAAPRVGERLAGLPLMAAAGAANPDAS